MFNDVLISDCIRRDNQRKAILLKRRRYFPDGFRSEKVT
jgi:hypothetical protein